MKSVLVIMGSDSDYAIMKNGLKQLQTWGIPFEAHICSAHRTPQKAAQLAAEAKSRGFGVLIAAAGLAAHLPGVLAAGTTLPVIGVPLASGPLAGVDALLAEVQMPSGIPVATVAINGAVNSAILAAQILALEDKHLAACLEAYKLELKDKVDKKDRGLAQQLAADGLA
ncbi:5-(carboxyamino)imidazole ribonucleotide mutase [Oscillospiraceae bacterium HV4-5-C5C]|nr:5-(carboxyamino)imidazole ribonucleotide mutase [Oscillospiraceae bacterium HV4-5-C5C]